MSRRFFLSYVRQGAAGGVMRIDPLRGPIAQPPRIEPELKVSRDGGELPVIRGPEIRVMDPDDVLTISRSVVTRRYPEPDSTDVPANELAYVEFSRPDLPWMFTPASATPEHRLRPWIVLVVVPLAAQLPSERASTLNIAVAELPDLRQSNAWAHAQIMADTAEDIGPAVVRGGAGAVSRLVCPRRLQEGVFYRACVVPAFDAALGPRWNVEAGGILEIPTYDSWTFRAGAKEDFEELVLRLHPVESTASLGTRPISAFRPWPTWKTLRALSGAPADTTPAIFPQDGALAAPRQSERPSLDDACATAFRTRMAQHVNHPFVDSNPPPGDDPREAPGSEGASLAPPIYGGHHANVQQVNAQATRWIEDLNLDPRRRAAAAMGSRYVQEHQEFLMARAWEQLRDIEKANHLRRIAELASVTADAVHRRSVTTLRPTEVIGLAGPARTRIRRADQTLSAAVASSVLPEAVATPAFARLTRPMGPVGHRMLRERPSTLIERGLQGEEGVLPPRITAAAPRVSLIRLSRSATGDVTTRRTAIHRRLVEGAEEATLAAALSAAQQAVDDAETASAGGMPFPGGLEAARTGIRNDLAAFDLRPGSVVALRTLFDDPLKVRVASDVVRDVVAFVARHEIAPAIDTPRPGRTLDPGQLRIEVAAELRPSKYLGIRLRDRIDVPIPQREDPLQQIMAHPEFPAPLALALVQEAPNAILPGLGTFPNNRVALLETNPPFIEAFLVGVNHEMNREFLWREFPTDQRGTPFKHFWPRPPAAGSDGREIEEIARWRLDRRLGTNLAGGRSAETVLLVRGDVLRRYPFTIVMAAPAIDAAGTVGPFSNWKLPTFPVPLGTDSMAYIFDLKVNDALGVPGWFFVFQEPRAVPRYGFDVSRGAESASWSDLSWPDVPLARGMFVDVDRPPTFAPADPRGAAWGGTAADMATIAMVRPFRLLFHARALFNV
jgi:hypothetical protein